MQRSKNSHCRNWKQVSHELNIANSRTHSTFIFKGHDKNKDFSHKDQDKDQDLYNKDQDKDKNLLHKDKDKDKDSALVLKESVRTSTMTRTNITAIVVVYIHQESDWLLRTNSSALVVERCCAAKVETTLQASTKLNCLVTEAYSRE